MTTTDTLGVQVLTGGKRGVSRKGYVYQPLFANGATDGTTESEIQKQEQAERVGKNNANRRVIWLALISSTGSILDYIRICDADGKDKFKLRGNGNTDYPLVFSWTKKGMKGLLLEDGDLLYHTTSD